MPSGALSYEVAILMWTVLFLVIIAVLTVILWWFGRKASRVEDDSSDLFEGTREPYGSKWLSILRGRD
jgi:hypothetical protein